MSNKIGSAEWIQNVTKSALDNHANQLNPNNHLYGGNNGGFSNMSVKSPMSSGAALVVGAAVAAVAIGVTCLAVNHFKKKKTMKADDEIVMIPEHTIVDETEDQ